MEDLILDHPERRQVYIDWVKNHFHPFGHPKWRPFPYEDSDDPIVYGGFPREEGANMKGNQNGLQLE